MLSPTAERAALLDVGVGDPQAPANAIPNVLANLVETETWRNSATVVMGLLLLGLGYWAYNGVRDAIARTQVAGTRRDPRHGRARRRRMGERSSRRHRAPGARPGHRRASVAARDVARGRHRSGVPAVRCDDAGAADLGSAWSRPRKSRSSCSIARGASSLRTFRSPAASACGRRCSASASIARSTARRNSSGRSPDPRLVYERGKDGAQTPARVAAGADSQAGPGPVPAVLAIGVLADREFARLFASARATTTTEAFAFGDDGLLLTSTRYAKEFVESGFYPDRNRLGRVRRAGARPRAAT